MRIRSDKPSSTARTVATGVLFLSLDPELGYLVPDGAGETSRWFLEASPGAKPARLDALRKPWARALIWRLEGWVFPGLIAHYTLRKRFLEDVAREALREGFAQVVVLGAGFDTLAYRLHLEFPAVQFIEVDHPATLGVKRRALEARRPPSANLSFLEVDLTRAKTSDAFLGLSTYHPDARTLFIAEGVLVYLTEIEVAGVFAFARDHSGPGSRIAFTFVESSPTSGVESSGQSRLVLLWLRLRQEPYKWGISVSDVASYLVAHGFTLRDLCTPEVLRERYLAIHGARLARGEYTCVAEKDSEAYTALES